MQRLDHYGADVIANGSADTGETINYTLTARNDGNVGLSGVVISDPRLPLLTCTPSQPANLAPTQTLVCSGSYVVQQADLDAGVAISNTATADSDQTAAVQDTATVPVTGAAAALSPRPAGRRPYHRAP